MFAGSVSVQRSDSGDDYSTTEQNFDAIMPADSLFTVDPSACVFWCAVALGALVKGQPIESVRNGVQYILLCRRQSVTAAGHAPMLVLPGGGGYDTNMAQSIFSPSTVWYFASTSAEAPHCASVSGGEVLPSGKGRAGQCFGSTERRGSKVSLRPLVVSSFPGYSSVTLFSTRQLGGR